MEQAFHSGTQMETRVQVPRQLDISVCMHIMAPARTSVRLMRAATTLRQAGMQVSVVDLERNASLERQEALDGMHITHLTMAGFFIPTRFKPWFLVKLARMFIKRTFALLRVPADVYHAHNETALFACYLAAALRHKPLIFEAYELPLVDPYYSRYQRRRLFRAVSTRLLRFVLPRCSGIIAVSPPHVQKLRQYYGGQPAALVRNIPVYQAPRRSDRLRQQFGLDTASKIALYQGNIQADRGLDILVRAARFLDPTITVVLLGTGDRDAELAALIAREQVGERVKMLPAVPYDELLEWTASADLGLITSPAAYSANVEVMLPNKLFEYLMAGLPVLSVPLEAVTELLERYGVGRTIPVLEPETLGHALNEMLADQPALEQMRKKALEASANELRWDVEQRQLLALYEKVLGIHLDGAANREAQHLLSQEAPL